MSGGRYSYAYARVEEMAGSLEGGADPLRRAFAAHLKRVAKAMHDVEWVDSGDYGAGAEREAVLAVVTREELAESAVAALEESIARAKAVVEVLREEERRNG